MSANNNKLAALIMGSMMAASTTATQSPGSVDELHKVHQVLEVFPRTELDRKLRRRLEARQSNNDFDKNECISAMSSVFDTRPTPASEVVDWMEENPSNAPRNNCNPTMPATIRDDWEDYLADNARWALNDFPGPVEWRDHCPGTDIIEEDEDLSSAMESGYGIWTPKRCRETNGIMEPEDYPTVVWTGEGAAETVSLYTWYESLYKNWETVLSDGRTSTTVPPFNSDATEASAGPSATSEEEDNDDDGSGAAREEKEECLSAISSVLELAPTPASEVVEWMEANPENVPGDNCNPTMPASIREDWEGYLVEQLRFNANRIPENQTWSDSCPPSDEFQEDEDLVSAASWGPWVPTNCLDGPLVSNGVRREPPLPTIVWVGDGTTETVELITWASSVMSESFLTELPDGRTSIAIPPLETTEDSAEPSATGEVDGDNDADSQDEDSEEEEEDGEDAESGTRSRNLIGSGIIVTIAGAFGFLIAI